MSLPEQGTTRKRQMYKIYENATRYTRTLQNVREPYKMYKMYKIYKIYEENMRKYETEEGIRVSLIFNGARSRQVARDLFFWRRERRGACIGSLTIGSSTYNLNLYE